MENLSEILSVFANDVGGSSERLFSKEVAFS